MGPFVACPLITIAYGDSKASSGSAGELYTLNCVMQVVLGHSIMPNTITLSCMQRYGTAGVVASVLLPLTSLVQQHVLFDGAVLCSTQQFLANQTGIMEP